MKITLKDLEKMKRENEETRIKLMQDDIKLMRELLKISAKENQK